MSAAGGSLRRRLLAAAALWIVLALLAVGVLLVALFRHHAGQELADRAAAPLDALAAALLAEPPATGAAAALRLAQEPGDEAFRRAYGGAYWWVIDEAGGLALRSRSWWDVQPPAAGWLEELPGDAIGRFDVLGPQGQPLAVWARRVELGGWDRPVVVAVGLETTRLDGMTRDFACTVAGALGVLALALWAASWLQVRLGLAPLARLQAALGPWRAGRAARLGSGFPSEVQPLVDELQAWADDNERLVRQAREQTGNLAHALKTPLAVLRNASAAWPGDDGELLRGQLGRIQQQVEWQLTRARALSSGRAAGRENGRRSDAAAVVDALLRTLARLHAERGIAAQRLGDAAPPPVAFEPEVLHDILGNLLDNAFRYTRTRVLVTMHVEPSVAALWLVIDDDGPGIPAGRRAAALQRGGRLDETQPGSGLGLAITDELVRLGGGDLLLDDAPTGGLRVQLRLPLVT